MLHTRVIAAFCAFVLWTGCSDDSQTSQLQDLVYDKNAKNVAVLFGVPDNLPGVRVDMRELESMFRQPEYGMTVYSYIDKPANEIARLAGQHAAEVDGNGTLLFYFSGHGAENGQLLAYNSMLDFSSVTNSIKQNRNAPLKRLLTIVDACFSGNLVNGQGANAITNDGSTPAAQGSSNFNQSGNPFGGMFGLNSYRNENDFRSYEQEYSEPLNDLTNQNIFDALAPFAGNRGFGLATSTLYEQVLVLSSSRKTETSGDTPNGGAFTTGFRQAISAAKSKGNTTIQQLIDNTISNVVHYGHTPVYRAEPQQEVLQDLVFGSTNPPPSTQQQTTTTAAGPTAATPAVTSNVTKGGMKVAVEDISTEDATIFVAPTAAGITSVAICGGDLATCEQSKKQDVPFKEYVGTKSIKKIFYSRQRVKIYAGRTYSVLGFTDGVLTHIQPIEFKAK